MARAFTLYLSSDICEWHYGNDDSGKLFATAPGCMITRAGVAAGDMLYGINVVVGTLFVVGRMKVDRVLTSYDDARALLGEAAWEMPEHAIAAEGTATPMYFSRQLPWDLTRQLRLRTADGTEMPLPMMEEDALDSKALREVRELTEASAKLLDDFLAEDFEELIGDGEDESDEVDAPLYELDAVDYDDDFDEDEDDLTDEELSAIAMDFEDTTQFSEVMEAANEIVVDYFQAEGYRVVTPDDGDSYYDFRCTKDDEEHHVLVFATPQEELRFLIADADLAAATEDDDALVCVVTNPGTDDAELSIFDPDALLDDFMYRPLQWGFWYAGDDGEEIEDGEEEDATA
jgi:hypothetical protein